VVNALAHGASGNEEAFAIMQEQQQPAVTNQAGDAVDLLWGAEKIASALNITRRKAFYLLEHRRLPAKKIGATWVASRSKLMKALVD
jgi:hypothetical protein